MRVVRRHPAPSQPHDQGKDRQCGDPLEGWPEGSSNVSPSEHRFLAIGLVGLLARKGVDLKGQVLIEQLNIDSDAQRLSGFLGLILSHQVADGMDMTAGM